MATTELDTDTDLEPLGGDRYAGTVTDRWDIGGNANGGYLLVIAGRALARSLPHPDPFTVTAHFLANPRPGPCEVEVEVVRSGRTLSTGEARLHSGDRECLRVLATYGELEALDGPELVTVVPPDLPPVEELPAARGPMPGGLEVSISDRFDTRFAPGQPSWVHGEPSGRGEVTGWMRFADGREPDPLSLLLFCDAMPPTAFELGFMGWVPTIELTVHVRARPAPGWLRVAMTTEVVQGGFLEEDATIWDSTGRVVAMSRQLARLALPPSR